MWHILQFQSVPFKQGLLHLLFPVTNEAGGIIPNLGLRFGNEIVLLPILGPLRAVEELLWVPRPFVVIDYVWDGLQVPQYVNQLIVALVSPGKAEREDMIDLRLISWKT